MKIEEFRAFLVKAGMIVSEWPLWKQNMLGDIQKPLSQAIPMPPTESDRNWIEDYAHENGRYHCLCCKCGCGFIGHKRRVVCKECFAPIQSPEDDLKPLLEKIVELSVRYSAFGLGLSEVEFTRLGRAADLGDAGKSRNDMCYGLSRSTGTAPADIADLASKSVQP